MAEDIDLEKCNFWNIRSPVTLTLTLTLDRVIRHIVVHHSSTSIYGQNFVEIGKKHFVDGRTDGRTDIHSPSNVIRSTRRSRPNNKIIIIIMIIYPTRDRVKQAVICIRMTFPERFLLSPYGLGQTIIFSSCFFFFLLLLLYGRPM